MAATTALMQPQQAPSSPASTITTNATNSLAPSVGSPLALISTTTTILTNNSNKTHHSSLLRNECSLSLSSSSESSSESSNDCTESLKEKLGPNAELTVISTKFEADMPIDSSTEDDDATLDNDNGADKLFDSNKRFKANGGDEHQTTATDTNQNENLISSLLSLSKSLAESIKSIDEHHPSKCEKRKKSTGKLERITERLHANKQNGNMPNGSKSEQSVKSHSTAEIVSQDQTPSSNKHDQDEQPVILSDEDVEIDEKNQVEDIDEDDEEDDEDDEEIKNGFRALGLMGNVAFIGDESFKCPVCGLQLDSQHTFTLHIRSHNPNDHSNTCSLCGKTLSSASSLDRHMLIHSGERPFKCSLCGMAFTTNGNMHRHMRTHGHGSIGYTPRGQKRRAKLLSQALEKAMAAAAAGEHVDYEALDKLKKSILGSTVTPSLAMPSSGRKREKSNHSQQQQHTIPNVGLLPSSQEQSPLDLSKSPASIEAAAAAAVAAAAHSNGKSPKLSNTNNTHINLSNHQINSMTSQAPPPSSTSLNIASNLAPLPAATGLNAFQTPPATKPEKGRPGRKKKQPCPVVSSPQPPPSLDVTNQLNSFHKKSLNTQAQIDLLKSTLTSVNSNKPPTVAQCSSNSTAASKPYPTLNPPTRCPICAHPIRNTMDLHYHMLAYHQQEKLFCNDCGMILDNYDTYTQHHCTASAATVMTALSQNPSLQSNLLFCSSNTSRMNFSSASLSTYASNIGGLFPPNLVAGLMSPAHLVKQFGQTSFFQNAVAAAAAAASTNDSAVLAAALSQQLMDLTSSTSTARTNSPITLPNNATSKAPQTANASSHHRFKASATPPNVSCSQCSQKFMSSKELKLHHETFCHECSLDCHTSSAFQLHQIKHSFEKLQQHQKTIQQSTCLKSEPTPAIKFCENLKKDQIQVLQKNVAECMFNSCSLASNVSKKNDKILQNLMTPQHSSNLKSSEALKTNEMVKVSNSRKNSHQSSPIASLTSMANMKPDLADIESILSIVHGTTATGKMKKQNRHQAINGGDAPRSSVSHHLQSSTPISPNRASDASASLCCSMQRIFSVTGGDAPNQPDSPQSADSAAVAIAGSSTSNIPVAESNHPQHSSKTDLNVNDDQPTALCLSKRSLSILDLKLKAKTEISHTTDEDETEKISCQNVKRARTDSASSSANSRPSNNHHHNCGNGVVNESSGGESGGSTTTSSSRFRCEPCRLSFKSMNALRRHNRGHTAGGGHSHACHLCPYKSLDKSTLIRHLRTHNGERPFQCAICKYAFTTKANCERHVRKRHRNLKSKNEIRSAMQYNRDMAATAAATRLVSEKIFIERDELPTSQDTICKQCSVDFGSNRELRAHLRVPNNPCSQQLKPFVCTICKIGFNTRNNCVRHIIKQHPSTIEVNDDEEAAAKHVSSLMIETGSNSSSLHSPLSNGQISNNSFSGSMSSGASSSLSECDEFESYDDENQVFEQKPKLINGSSSNSSFAALVQIAQKQAINGSIPLNLSKKSESDESIDD